MTNTSSKQTLQQSSPLSGAILFGGHIALATVAYRGQHRFPVTYLQMLQTDALQAGP